MEILYTANSPGLDRFSEQRAVDRCLGRCTGEAQISGSETTQMLTLESANTGTMRRSGASWLVKFSAQG